MAANGALGLRKAWSGGVPTTSNRHYNEFRSCLRISLQSLEKLGAEWCRQQAIDTTTNIACTSSAGYCNSKPRTGTIECSERLGAEWSTSAPTVELAMIETDKRVLTEQIKMLLRPEYPDRPVSRRFTVPARCSTGRFWTSEITNGTGTAPVERVPSIRRDGNGRQPYRLYIILPTDSDHSHWSPTELLDFRAQKGLERSGPRLHILIAHSLKFPRGAENKISLRHILTAGYRKHKQPQAPNREAPKPKQPPTKSRAYSLKFSHTHRKQKQAFNQFRSQVEYYTFNSRFTLVQLEPNPELGQLSHFVSIPASHSLKFSTGTETNQASTRIPTAG
ncbi:hypothetical protein B0H16DRAFT_1477457 [Mycena metata]|uniref:Uncharacterized protein n=1 Tax=Mycena metata TaxID=1033252 RepID=A0AAD7HA10_9AGAR|nr:hypothetical protein B0H16DRAFT_1477457 [Mycena metata]